MVADMKRGFTILVVIIAVFAGQNAMGQGTQSDFPAFEDASIELNNRIEIYPNPAVDYINIEIRESKLVETRIVLHNIIGNKIEIHPEKITDNKFRIDVKELPPGYYLLSIKDPVIDFNRTYKFLKR